MTINVGYSVVEEHGRTGVLVTARERSWGPDYLQFGIALSGDARGENSYNFGLAYLKTAVNPLGGELRFAGQFGSEPAIVGEWYQPLDATSRFFVQPVVWHRTRTFNQYTPDGDKLSQYRVRALGAELLLGREVSVFGRAAVGYRSARGDADREIGALSLPEGDFNSGSMIAQIWVDRLDNVYFPAKGYNAKLEYEFLREDFGNDQDLDQVEFTGMYFKTVGANTFGFGALFMSTMEGNAAIQDRFRLGGFLHLSGYDQDSISGQHSALVNAVYYRRFTELKLLPWYIGGSLEYGNVWEDRDAMAFDSGIAAGSVFLGADTPIGPLYLGYGHAEQGRNAGFLYLGKTF